MLYVSFVCARVRGRGVSCGARHVGVREMRRYIVGGAGAIVRALSVVRVRFIPKGHENGVWFADLGGWQSAAVAFLYRIGGKGVSFSVFFISPFRIL